MAMAAELRNVARVVGVLVGMTSLVGCRTAGPVAREEEPMPKLKGPIFNYDCTEFFYVNAIREGVDGGALVDRYVDLLAEGGVTAMMCNPNARRTNYRSAVWQSFWDGYEPDGPDDQPFLRPIAPDRRAGFRRMTHSMWALDRQGVDYPARIVARCRERGISPWISIRMNDCHDNDNLAHPFHGDLWRQERLFRGEGGGVSRYFARCLDYARSEVRDMYRALIEECIRRYDPDGMELDFLREPYLFAPGAEAEGAGILHEWIRDIRRLTDRAGTERGRPMRLGVRVPSCVDTARSWGLDAVAWARDGLVDLVVPTPRWATLEFDMPLDEWREQLAGTGVTLAGGLEALCQPIPGGARAHASVEHATGAATAVLYAGADAVYLFNHFGYPVNQQPVLRAMSSLETISALPRRHAITYRDIIGCGESYQPPLPAEGTALAFQILTGPSPGETDDVTLIALVKGTPAAPAAAVNGMACTVLRSTPQEGNTLLEYRVPLAAQPGKRRDQITFAAEAPVTILAVEVRIAPSGRD